MSLEIAPGWVCLFLSETCLSLAFDGRAPSMDEERAENHENGDERWGLFLHFL